MSKNLYAAVVSPLHKTIVSEKFNSSLKIQSSLSPYGYTGLSKSQNLKVLQTFH